MSDLQERIYSHRFPEIGRLLRENSEQIIDRWLRRALRVQPSDHLAEMRDWLPAFLEEMGQTLSQSPAPTEERHTALALHHGKQRFGSGWSLRELVRDFQLLRVTLAEFLEESLDHPLTLAEVVAIGYVIDEAIEVSVDVYTDIKESELSEAHDRITEFLPVLAHELRNPLDVMQSVVHTLSSLDNVDSEVTHLLQRQCQQLLRLVEDLTDVERLKKGTIVLHQETIEIHELLQPILDEHAALLAEKELELETSFAKGPLSVKGDRWRLTQVFANILSNAIKFSEPGGRITLSTEVDEEKGELIVRIEDCGLGIEPGLLDKIFDKYRQGRSHVSQTGPGGLGLGLAIVKKIVNLHGGEVSADSDGRGQGSCFRIRLPRA